MFLSVGWPTQFTYKEVVLCLHILQENLLQFYSHSLHDLHSHKDTLILYAVLFLVVLIATCNPASISTLHCKKTVYFGVKTEKIITRKWKEVLGEVAPHKWFEQTGNMQRTKATVGI
jgi:hypothetical protein